MDHHTVGLCDDDEEMKQLDAVLIGHKLAQLVTTVDDSRAKLGHTQSLLFLKESDHDVLALLHRSLTKVGTQPLTHHIHLGVHHLAVGTDNVRSQHQQRETKRVALFLLTLLRSVASVSA